MASSAATVSTMSSIASAATVSSALSAATVSIASAMRLAALRLQRPTGRGVSSAAASMASSCRASRCRRLLDGLRGRRSIAAAAAPRWRLVGRDRLDDLLDRLGGAASSAYSAAATVSIVSAMTSSAAATLSSFAAAASRSAAISSAAAASRSGLVLGDGLDDVGDGLGGDGLLGSFRLDGELDDIGVGRVGALGLSQLLADLGEGGRERVVDAALRLLDRVAHRVATLRARSALAARARTTADRAPGPGEPAAPRPA